MWQRLFNIVRILQWSVVIPITMIGTSYILEKANIWKKRDFGGNLCHVSMSDIALENYFQLWRICSVETSLAYDIILIFSWSLQYSGNSRYGQKPFPSSIRHIEKRNLRAHGSSRWLSRISGYGFLCTGFLRTNVYNFRKSVDSREFFNFFIFCPNSLYSTLISKITLKLVTAFFFFFFWGIRQSLKNSKSTLFRVWN